MTNTGAGGSGWPDYPAGQGPQPPVPPQYPPPAYQPPPAYEPAPYPPPAYQPPPAYEPPYTPAYGQQPTQQLPAVPGANWPQPGYPQQQPGYGPPAPPGPPYGPYGPGGPGGAGSGGSGGNRRVIIAAIVALVLIAGGLTTFFLLRGEDDKPAASPTSTSSRSPSPSQSTFPSGTSSTPDFPSDSPRPTDSFDAPSDTTYQTPASSDAVATLKKYFQAIANERQSAAAPLICREYLSDWTVSQKSTFSGITDIKYDGSATRPSTGGLRYDLALVYTVDGKSDSDNVSFLLVQEDGAAKVCGIEAD